MDEITFGRAVRALRIRRRWTQAELGDRAGASRGVVARIEQGRAARVTIATLDRVAAALGARVLVKLLWQGEGLDRLLDGRHAVVVEEVVRVLGAAGWDVATEVSFNEYGERGSIDVLALHRITRALLVVEVKTTIGDAQELQSTLDRKVRLAPKVASRRGWSASAVCKLLVVVDSRSNRAVVDRLVATFAGSFPDRTRACRRWIATPELKQPLQGLWFLNTGGQAVITQRVRARRRPATQDPSARTGC